MTRSVSWSDKVCFWDWANFILILKRLRSHRTLLENKWQNGKHLTAQSASGQIFLQYPIRRSKCSNTCTLDRCALCRLPRQPFNHINLYCSRRSIFWHPSNAKNLLSGEALFSSSRLRIWIDFVPYKKTQQGAATSGIKALLEMRWKVCWWRLGCYWIPNSLNLLIYCG